MRPYLAWAVMGVLLISSQLSQPQASTSSHNAGSPLSVADVEHGLKAGVSNTRMSALVKQYGIDFELTDVTEKQLRAAGATSDLLLMISRGTRSRVESETTSSEQPEKQNSRTLPSGQQQPIATQEILAELVRGQVDCTALGLGIPDIALFKSMEISPDVAGRIDCGQYVDILNTHGAWLEVRSDSGARGYLLGNTVRVIGAATKAYQGSAGAGYDAPSTPAGGVGTSECRRDYAGCRLQ